MSELDNVFGVAPSEPVEEVQGQGEQEDTQEETITEESTPDAGQVEEPTETKEQPLILGKFKTQDDLSKSYQNLEREHTRLRQELAKLQTQPAPKQEQPQENDEETRLIAWYNQEVQTNPINANAVLARYMAQKEIDSRMAQVEQRVNPILEERQANQWIQQTASKYKDFYDYTDKITEVIPELIAEDQNLAKSPQLYKLAYLEAKSRVLEENAKTAFENGKKSAFDGKTAKQKLNNEVSKQTTKDPLPEGINIISEGDGIFL